MALNLIAGFDLYPATMLDETTPEHGSGVRGTPLGMSFSPGTASNCYFGVSTREEDMFGEGEERYRALVLDRKAVGSATAYWNVFSRSNYNTAAEKNFTHRYVLGFAFKDLSNPGVHNGQQIARCEVTGSVKSNISFFHIDAAGYFVFGGLRTNTLCEPGKEYYIELELSFHPPSSSSTVFPLVFKAYLDDVLVTTRNIVSITGSNAASFSVRLGYPYSTTSDTSRVRYGFAHIYRIIRGLSEPEDSIYANRLGPQKVRLVGLKEVVENQGWVTQGASSEIDAISGVGRGDPEQYLSSPEDEGEIRFALDLPTNSRSIIHGVDFHTATSRDGTAARNLNISLTAADGTAIVEGVETPDTSIGYKKSFQLRGDTAESAEFLKHNSLANAELTLKAPLS